MSAARSEGRGCSRQDAGFSLIELVVVIAIIGILVAIAIPVYGEIQQNAREKQAAGLAHNGSQVVAAAIEDADPLHPPHQMLEDSEVSDQYTYSLTPDAAAITNANYCVTVTVNTDGVGVSKKSGPNC